MVNAWVASGATALVMSERARGVMRRGAAYGLAGAMTVGDAIIGAGKTVVDSGGNVAHGASDIASGLLDEARSVKEHQGGERKTGGAGQQRKSTTRSHGSTAASRAGNG